MASLQQCPNGSFHITFYFAGRKFKRSLKTKQRRKAAAMRIRLEENIQLVETGRLVLADDVDLPTFLLSDGKLNEKSIGPASLRLGDLYQTYTESIPADALEATALTTTALHVRSMVRVPGAFQWESDDTLVGRDRRLM